MWGRHLESLRTLLHSLTVVVPKRLGTATEEAEDELSCPPLWARGRLQAFWVN